MLSDLHWINHLIIKLALSNTRPTNFELFADDGQLCQLDYNGRITKQPFQFDNQQRYDAIGVVLDEIVYDLLETEKLVPVFLGPDPHQAGFVFCTQPDLNQVNKLLILVQGDSGIRAGQWARQLIVNVSLEVGTQVSCIKEARALGYDVLVMNPNESRPGSTTGEEHVRTVWDIYIAPATNLKHIAFIAHGHGGDLTLELAHYKPQEFRALVFGVAFVSARLNFPKYMQSFNLMKQVGANINSLHNQCA